MENAAEDQVTRIPPVNKRGGKWVRMGMEEYRIPPLGFGAIQELQSRLGALQGMTAAPTPEQVKIVAEIVHMALQRNYPDIKAEQVAEMLDLGNFREVFGAVLSMSGYSEGKPSGEQPATSP
ncbi:MAG TPA: hypothetical protein VIY48_11950 [Candidatus Paceibacterota bacterium]